MNLFSFKQPLVTTSILALALATLVGCKGVVSNGGSSGGDGGAGDGGSGGGAGSTVTQPSGGAGGDTGCDPAACPTPAVAMDATMFAVTMNTDPPFPDIQHLIYGGGYGAPACFAPHGDQSQCGGSTVDIMIATSKFVPGSYSLTDPDLDILIMETIDYGGGECAGAAAGSLDGGTLILHAIDDLTVTFSVEGVEPVLDFPVNGYFQASRCYLEY